MPTRDHSDRRLFSVGSVNADLVTRVAVLPTPGETTIASKAEYTPGGKALNRAVAARRLGARAVLVGAVGGDFHGRALRRFLAAQGVETGSVMTISKAQTGLATVVVAEGGENMIILVPGANDCLSAQHTYCSGLTSADIVAIDLEVPLDAARQALACAREVGAFTILNTAPAITQAQELFAQAGCLVMNEAELAALSGNVLGRNSTLKEIRDAANTIRAKSQPVIVTLGSRGALLVSDGIAAHVAGLDSTPVSSAGAGDCFIGALAAALLEDACLKDAIGFAVVAAGLSVELEGTAVSMPTRVDVETRRMR